MDLTQAYVRHALQLIRISNGFGVDANDQIRKLGTSLRRLLAGSDVSSLGIRDLRRLITEADQLIIDTFDTLKGTQNDATSELIDIESKWARKVAKWDAESSDAAILRANQNFQVMGLTTDEHFDNIAAKLQREVRAQVRMGRVAGQSDKEIAARVVGAQDQRGGVLDSTRKDTQALIEGATNAAADAGRRATMAANGVNILQWHAVLDLNVCPSCGERADLYWTIGGDPVDHEIPYATIPLHRLCRCLYIPMKVPAANLPKLKNKDRWEQFMNSLNEEDQDQVFGAGRADLWRSGTISLADMIGQDGMVLTLKELRQSLAD